MPTISVHRPQELEAALDAAILGIPIKGKLGRALHLRAASFLRDAGFVADVEDSRSFMGTNAPAWRSRDTGEIEATAGRRRLDLVVYDEGLPVALVEIESDLLDLRENGTSNRNGHYDVLSIPRSAAARHFNSYKSIERMASAAYFHWARNIHFDDAPAALARFESVESDDPLHHNPLSLPMYLVVGHCRPSDIRILAPRLESLGAKLKYAELRG